MTNKKQEKLFDEPLIPWEEGSNPQHAQVVFDRPLRTIFAYSIPDDLADRIEAGKRVLAPFGQGNSRTTGFCVGIGREAPGDRRLKPILSVLDDRPLLSPAILELTRWMADYYFCAWGQVLEAVLPRAVKSGSGTRWTALLSPIPEADRPEANLTPKQRRAWDTLVEMGKPASAKEIGLAARCGPEVVKALIRKGQVTVKRERTYQRTPKIEPVLWDRPLSLNADQQSAYARIADAIRAGRAHTFLLHGVTGSGKTEVYLRAIADAVERRREALVLVPEISLTPQTIERFRRRFDHVAVLHSHLSDVERHWHWRRIAAGEIQVVIGARSALFAPCRNLGLVVLDEEHETTFKQESTPRYHAREVAEQRCRLERATLILGSATPSLESWHAASIGRYTLLSLPRRVADLEMPRVVAIDLRSDAQPRGGLRALSPPLVRAIGATVADRGQVILMLNRRGFSTMILCPQCGHVETCDHCDISLTFHQRLARLVCHSCDAEYPVPDRCSECAKPAIRYSGVGTERLEQEVRARFPNRTCARMDSDTMRSVGHYERTLSAFRRGEVDILVGTQMIAKGLDFPNVRLVGVVTADTARNLPDFRASERTFQLIAQVAGRTGRGDSLGRVLVQTYNPDDPAILAACRHDYGRFIAQELPIRSEYGYPPFQSLVRIIVRSKSEQSAQEASRRLAERIRECVPTDDDSIRVLGPAPAPVPKLRDRYRMHFQIHALDPAIRQPLLDRVLADFEFPSDVEYAIDIDPVNMM